MMAASGHLSSPISSRPAAHCRGHAPGAVGRAELGVVLSIAFELERNSSVQGKPLAYPIRPKIRTRIVNDAAALVHQLCLLRVCTTISVNYPLTRDHELRARLLGTRPCKTVRIVTRTPFQPIEGDTTFEPDVFWKVSLREHKIASIAACPYPRTVYLDNDVVILNASSMFSWFDRMGSAALSARRDIDNGVANTFAVTPLVPDSFPELNGGILYLRCPEATPIMNEWKRNYLGGPGKELPGGAHQHDPKTSLTAGNANDQMALRIAAYRHRDLFIHLPVDCSKECFGCRAVGHRFKKTHGHFGKGCNSGHYAGGGHDKVRLYANATLRDFERRIRA